ncbi:hypothetical protein K0M31_017388 [Melipona bicolor]|uniref:Uncharacterized protein n=1 Tax=Melipona bicolor TaxID=60889 RepID=A0AA40G4Z6_9HYME|nr:hypothetical protein K0M31_017388 [Melipona bicolor]
MKFITSVFFFLLIGILVSAIPRGPSEMSPEDELEQREKRDVPADFAYETKEESDSVSSLSKRSIPSDAVNNLTNIVEPLRDQLNNVTLGELIEILENLISNSTNSDISSETVLNLIRQILELPILGNIIRVGAALADLPTNVVAVAVAIIIRVIAVLPLPIPLIPIPPILIPPMPIPPILIPPMPIPPLPIPPMPIPPIPRPRPLL